MTADSDKDTEHWKRFGRWLRAKRIERSHQTGLPRAELAKICGVHDNSWANWERGGRNMAGHWIVYRPKPDNLHGIAKALDLPPADVFKRAGVRMDNDVLDTLGPDGQDKLDRILNLLQTLVKEMPHMREEIEKVSGDLSEVTGQVKRRARR